MSAATESPSQIELEAEAIEAIAARVVELLSGERNWELLDAAALAVRLKVERDWVYEHAAELGVIRLGESGRARLRFDPSVVRARLGPAVPDGLHGERSEPRRQRAKNLVKRPRRGLDCGKPERRAGARSANPAAGAKRRCANTSATPRPQHGR
jgi:hypothetical protein